MYLLPRRQLQIHKLCIEAPGFLRDAELDLYDRVRIVLLTETFITHHLQRKTSIRLV